MTTARLPLRFLIATLALAALLLAAACSGEEPTSATDSEKADPFAYEEQGKAYPTPTLGPAIAMMDADAAASDDAYAAEEDGGALGPPGEPSGGDGFGSVRLSPLAQNRIVVHSAHTSIVVDDVAAGLDRITEVAVSLGGWLVSSERKSRHAGRAAIRVPAASLDEALARIEAAAQDVASRSITSEDVTDQYVDTQSRLSGLQATQQRLLGFLDQAQNVEEALMVQEQLASIQFQIEEMQGRLNYFDQVSAFSLIQADLTLAPLPMRVDAGQDATFRASEPAKFRATFAPPDDIDEFKFVWDFGDGSTLAGYSSTLTPNGNRVTATVNHTYSNSDDSPYIVSVTLTGTGEGGIAEGMDSLLATIVEVPVIEVFAGDHRTVEEGEEARYTASFTAPGELWDYEYEWDFGDGSPIVAGTIDAGTRIEVAHAYADYRSYSYPAQVTVSAMSEAGPVSASASFSVEVTESAGFLVGGWDAGNTLRDAVRTLSAVGIVLLYVLIWAVVFSPLIVLGFFLFRMASRLGNRLLATRPSRPDDPSDSSEAQP